MTPQDFTRLRYGLFVHYGLYSLLERGEWAMNREQLATTAMDELARRFAPERFDADALCQLALDGGMKYLVFTTMHHEGFRLYDTALSPHNAMAVAGRDLVREVVDAARRHGLAVGLYHSLNNWYDRPDGVDALESPEDKARFQENTLARLKELVRRFSPVDILWYDGWWPFGADGWQAERMNRELLDIQPGLLFNGRNGLPGDFATPEQRLDAPDPWRPWEACMTLNDHWGFHRGDDNWKSPRDVVRLLLQCAAGKGNLLLNIGPRGDGSVPEASADIVRMVGAWLRAGGDEAVADTDVLRFDPHERQPGDRGDWCHAGLFTASGQRLYLTVLYWPGDRLTITGLEARVEEVTAAGESLRFTQDDGRVTVDLPAALASAFCPVLRFACDRPPSLYRNGGMRNPPFPHVRYDP